jgi:hypothetical protein
VDGIDVWCLGLTAWEVAVAVCPLCCGLNEVDSGGLYFAEDQAPSERVRI